MGVGTARSSQCSGEGLVQQRLLQRRKRGELPLGEAGEALGFFAEFNEAIRNSSLFGKLRERNRIFGDALCSKVWLSCAILKSFDESLSRWAGEKEIEKASVQKR